MSPAIDPLSPLSVYRAFVVQFRLAANPAQGQWVGRVEHVASGQSTGFNTIEELMTFIVRVLDQESSSPMK